MNKKLLVCILIIIPFLMMIGLLPAANRITPIILGLPFLHFWLFLSMIVTPICSYTIYRIQKAEGSLEE